MGTVAKKAKKIERLKKQLLVAGGFSASYDTKKLMH